MLILPTMRRNDPFTLIELVVVMVIIAMATGIAVATFRGESPVRKLSSAGLAFETFCAGVRYQAQESGEDRIVYLDTGEAVLLVKTPLPPDTREEDLPQEEEEARIIKRWHFPEGFTLDPETLELPEGSEDEEEIELFRFFPDGGAAGMMELTFTFKELKRRYRISPLTGQMSLIPEEEE